MKTKTKTIISDKVSSGNIQKKKIKKFQRKGRKRKGRTKILSLRKRKEIANAKFKLLKKEDLI